MKWNDKTQEPSTAELVLRQCDRRTATRIKKQSVSMNIGGEIWWDTSQAYCHYDILYLVLRGLCKKDTDQPWLVKLDKSL